MYIYAKYIFRKFEIRFSDESISEMGYSIATFKKSSINVHSKSIFKASIIFSPFYRFSILLSLLVNVSEVGEGMIEK